MNNKKNFYFFLFLLVLPIAFSANNITYDHNHLNNDTYADSANPNDNKATSEELYSGKNPIGTDWRAFMKFHNIDSSILTNRINATLYLYVFNGPDNSGTTIRLYNVTQNWHETTLTYNSQPAIGTLLKIESISAFFTGWKAIDVNSSILEVYNTGQGYAFDTQDGNGDDVAYSSTDSGSNKPYLVIYYGDIIKPTYSNLQNNGTTTYTNGYVNFSVDASDDENLGSIISMTNITGEWKSYTSTISGTSYSFHFINQTNLTRGDYVCANFSIIDAGSNVNDTGHTCFTINNSAPTLKTDLTFTNGSSNHWFNVTAEFT
ncbi:MAG: DNRLRE domain-containing protein, partial [Nanoarchaeota archaeon]|nr:DNRLRE domain-containing protein [Nanoarchaeota archaeon]